MRHIATGAVVIVVTAMAVSGCATKKFVHAEVDDVNKKVGSLTTALEGTQARTQQNEKGIAAVDAKADAAGRSATDARTAADGAASASKEVDTRLTGRVAGVEQAAQASRKLIYEVTLSEGQDRFKSNTADLPDDVKLRLDQMVGGLKTDARSVFIEIEGHTDSQGAADYNERLGLGRAEAAKRYLYEHHQVPLHKMSVISYGSTKPVAPNTTAAGRAQNRRVVVRVLA